MNEIQTQLLYICYLVFAKVVIWKCSCQKGNE